MLNATHLIRRGKYYSWRRKARGLVVQVALRTSDHRIPCRLAVKDTAASEELWEDLTQHLVDVDEVLAALRAVLTGHGESPDTAIIQAITAQQPHAPAEEKVALGPSIPAVAARLADARI